MFARIERLLQSRERTVFNNFSDTDDIESEDQNENIYKQLATLNPQSTTLDPQSTTRKSKSVPNPQPSVQFTLNHDIINEDFALNTQRNKNGI